MGKNIKYHLGCGSIYLDGYHNVDFPLENHTVNQNVRVDEHADLLTIKLEKCSEIKSSHVFEHFNYSDSLYLLYQWYNALEIEGILKINIPDVENLSIALKDASIEKSFRIIRYLYGSHESSWAYHINGWTKKTLSYVLKKIGFEIISANQTGDVNSDYPNCSVEITAIKKEDKDKELVMDSILSMFKLYKNGDTDFENKLEEHLKKELFKKIQAC